MLYMSSIVGPQLGCRGGTPALWTCLVREENFFHPNPGQFDCL